MMVESHEGNGIAVQEGSVRDSVEGRNPHDKQKRSPLLSFSSSPLKKAEDDNGDEVCDVHDDEKAERGKPNRKDHDDIGSEPGPLHGELNDIESAHEVTLMFYNYYELKPKLKETVMVLNNLFYFLSALAGDSMRTMDNRDLTVLYCTAHERFNQLFISFPGKAYAVETFFNFLPGRHGKDWPPLFAAHIEGLRKDEPSREWSKRHASVQIVDMIPLRECYFGFKVWEAYCEVKAMVNENLNAKFVSPKDLKAGQTERDMLQKIRKQLWPANCLKRAKQSVDNGMKNKLKNGGFSVVITKEKPYSRWVEEKYARLMVEIDFKWFPKEWLAFIMLGKPAKYSQLLSFLGKEMFN